MCVCVEGDGRRWENNKIEKGRFGGVRLFAAQKTVPMIVFSLQREREKK